MNLRHPTPTLPLALAVDELLFGDTSVPEALDPSLRRVLANRLATKAPGRHLGTLRLDSHTILTPPTDRVPFVWSPRRARRLLGAAAARSVIEGRSPHPTAAVRDEVAQVVARAFREHTRPGSLGTWLAEAPVGVQAAAIAEASAWTTDLLTALSPRLLEAQPLVGRGDPVWAVPGAPWISLRARRDLEVALDESQATRALLCLRAGRPRRNLADDLGLVGLIDALCRPTAPLPSRVVGLWPAAGRVVAIDIDAEVVRRAARQTVAFVEQRRISPAVAA